MPKIFISYRREDSQWPVDRIHQALKPHVGDPKADIFVDVDNIPVGVDWVAYLDSKVAQCDVLLAVIGPDWLSVKNPKTGKRRLDDPKDFVRIEIASALKRGVAVAPVLLDGVELPEPEDVPEDIRPLLGRQGVEVTRMNFDADVQRLITGLGLGKHAASPTQSSSRRDAPTGSSAPMIALALLVLAAGGVGAYGFTQGWFGRIAEASDTASAGNLAAPAPAAPDPAEAAAWEMADGLNSAEAYKSYLASYPKGAHVGDANDALAAIADEADWTKAAGRGRPELNGYLAAHPSGAYTQEASTQLAALDAAERAAAEAKSEDQRREIERRAAEQREADRKAAEKRSDQNAWAIASAANTSVAYRSYLDRYPNGINVKIARERITQIEPKAHFSASDFSISEIMKSPTAKAVLAKHLADDPDTFDELVDLGAEQDIATLEEFWEYLKEELEIYQKDPAEVEYAGLIRRTISKLPAIDRDLRKLP